MDELPLTKSIVRQTPATVHRACTGAGRLRGTDCRRTEGPLPCHSARSLPCRGGRPAGDVACCSSGLHCRDAVGAHALNACMHALTAAVWLQLASYRRTGALRRGLVLRCLRGQLVGLPHHRQLAREPAAAATEVQHATFAARCNVLNSPTMQTRNRLNRP